MVVVVVVVVVAVTMPQWKGITIIIVFNLYITFSPLQSTGYIQNVPNVQSPGQRRIWWSVCVSSKSDRENVCLQKIRKKEDKEEERWSDGAHWETNSPKN